MVSPRESEVIRTLRDHLASAVGPVRSLQPVAGGGAQGADVWHAVLASGEKVAVKRHAHDGAGEVEFGVLQMLHRLGAPVAQPLQWDPQRRLLVTEWLESRTLADALHDTGHNHAVQSHSLRQLTHNLVLGCEVLETAFQGIAARLPLRETGEQTRRHTELRERCDRAPETFTRLAAFCDRSTPQGWESAMREAWSAVADAICAGRVTFGGRDCTPRNVLTDGCAVWFVDFAVIGLDWPEARLAQYAAAVGAREPSVPLQSLLTHRDERWYVESGCIESAQLDMHHVVLWSEVVRLLLNGEQDPLNSKDELLRRRLKQALQLALFPLASQTPAESVRALIATVFAQGSRQDCF